MRYHVYIYSSYLLCRCRSTSHFNIPLHCGTVCIFIRLPLLLLQVDIPLDGKCCFGIPLPCGTLCIFYQVTCSIAAGHHPIPLGTNTCGLHRICPLAGDPHPITLSLFCTLSLLLLALCSELSCRNHCAHPVIIIFICFSGHRLCDLEVIYQLLPGFYSPPIAPGKGINAQAGTLETGTLSYRCCAGQVCRAAFPVTGKYFRLRYIHCYITIPVCL